MINSIGELFKRMKADAGRLAWIVSIITLLLWLDSWLPERTQEALLSPLLSSTTIVLGIAALSHVTRRVLFPQLDLQKLAAKACETSVGASIVFFGVAMIVATLIYANVSIMR